MKIHMGLCIMSLALAACGKSSGSNDAPNNNPTLPEQQLKITDNMNQMTDSSRNLMSVQFFRFKTNDVADLLISEYQTKSTECRNSRPIQITYFLNDLSKEGGDWLGQEIQETDGIYRVNELAAQEYKLGIKIDNPGQCLVTHRFAVDLMSLDEPDQNNEDEVAFEKHPIVKKFAKAGIEVKNEGSQDKIESSLKKLNEIYSEIVQRKTMIGVVVISMGKFFTYQQVEGSNRIPRLTVDLSQSKQNLISFLRGLDEAVALFNNDLQGMKLNLRSAIWGEDAAAILKSQLATILTYKEKLAELRPFIDIFETTAQFTKYDAPRKTLSFGLADNQEMHEKYFEVIGLQGNLMRDLTMEIEAEDLSRYRGLDDFILALKTLENEKEDLMALKGTVKHITVKNPLEDRYVYGLDTETGKLYFTPFNSADFSYVVDAFIGQVELEKELGVRIIPHETLSSYFYPETIHMMLELRPDLLAKRHLFDTIKSSFTNRLQNKVLEVNYSPTGAGKPTATDILRAYLNTL